MLVNGRCDQTECLLASVWQTDVVLSTGVCIVLHTEDSPESIQETDAPNADTAASMEGYDSPQMNSNRLAVKDHGAFKQLCESG